MKKILVVIAVFSICVGSFAVDNKKRTDAGENMEIVNVRTADTVISSTKYDKIKCIFADVGGIVKFKIRTPSGDTITRVRALNDATWYPLSNVVKVFPLYNGSDSTTCQVYDSTGVLRRGIGLVF